MPGTHRVLVVDDDDDLRDVLAEFFRIEGYDVAGAGNGEEALAYLQGNSPPCVILLDLMMPVMTGPEFRQRQLGDPGMAAIPVVVLSAAYDAAHQAETLKAHRCFGKPLDLFRLLETVREIC
jgi:CheY-like chemotaxis protein